MDMQLNTHILSPSELSVATDHDVLVALYQFITITTMTAFAIILFYGVFRFLVWFLPNYWYRSKDGL